MTEPATDSDSGRTEPDDARDDNVIPQADRLEKIRDLVAYWANPTAEGSAASVRRALTLKPRDYGYYAQAARVLGFVERIGQSRYRVTARGFALLQSEPGSPVEREMFFGAIDCAPSLAPVRAYLHGDEQLGRDELKARVSTAEKVSGQTIARRAGAMRSWRRYLTEVATPAAPPQLGLFEAAGIDSGQEPWPPPERFPHNRPGHTVAAIVYEDLLASNDALIVAGYASLDELLRLISRIEQKPERLRIIFGAEPFQTSRTRFVLGHNSFSDEVRRYWLEQGVSLRLSGGIIRAKQFLTDGRLVARIQSDKHDLHAKIYVADRAATEGSSNFTDQGLRRKREVNGRFRRVNERKRYDELRDLAEIYWKDGVDFTAELRALLDQLLQKVTWRHALGRACAELLEGRWAEQRYSLPDNWEERVPLWPTQEQGIAQALWILENVGSVLVADAAGSGKTRMGAHLIGAVLRHLVSRGRITALDPLISCPPDAVLDKWRDELSACGMTALTPFSHGVLSSSSAADHERAQRAIQRAPIVVVDEAHNFLNPTSKRTRAILGNIADHKVLLTATPVSRRPSDLLGIVDLLGADNFDDEALDLMSALLRRRVRFTSELSERERDSLRREIAKFTVRRTRAMLNTAVDREPMRYLNDEGRPCRYPRQQPEFYDCGEPGDFLDVAAQIRELASNLRGVLFLKTGLELPAELADEGWDESRFVYMRLRGARGLARHHVMAAFRSSRAALYEHLLGTEIASSQFEISGLTKGDSGAVIEEVTAVAGNVPEHHVSCELPSWLTDPGEHARAAQEEAAIYQRIADLVRALPPVREEAKARVLARLSEQHQAVLAFDSRPITLAELRQRVQTMTRAEPVLAIGGDPTARRRVTELLSRTSRGGRCVVLCSDSMAEGFNLQRASAVVHLDMPSVVRIAEQRTGRVDRMDSPHDTIQVLWPNDPPEIALRGDERLIAHNEFVAGVLGSNLVLPSDEPSASEGDVVAPAAFIAELEDDDRDWNDDAFSPVRSFIEGPERLVSPETYDEVRGCLARVVSAVSVIRASRPWAFLAVGATERTAPRWVYLDSPSARPITSLHEVADHLRRHLTSDTQDADFDERAMDLLAAFLEHLQACERSLLPRIKQRALTQMEATICDYQERTPIVDLVRHGALRELAALVEPNSRFDLASVADCWLEAIRPVRYKWLQRRTRRRAFALLKELESDLRAEPLSTESLGAAFSHLQGSRPLAERIVAVIIGVP